VENGTVGGKRRGKERRGNKRGGTRRGPQKLVHTRDIQNPEEYPDWQ